MAALNGSEIEVVLVGFVGLCLVLLIACALMAKVEREPMSPMARALDALADAVGGERR